MDTLTTTFTIPDWIRQGLTSGQYERVGGVIRDSSTKQIEAWLREGPAADGIPEIEGFPPLQGVLTTTSILNLGLSTMSFSIVIHRLNELERRLKDTQELLQKLDRKIDLSFYANFRAALDLAFNAFTMTQSGKRKSMAIQAINRFLEAQHVYVGLVDSELELGSQIIDEYLLTLALAYIAEVRCHLELEEVNTAIRRFQEGTAILRDRTQHYVKLLLTSNPAVYLHPDFKGKIDLKRLTQIYQWIDSSLNEHSVFDQLREGMFNWRHKRGTWVESLPAAIVSRVEVKGGFMGPDNADIRKAAFKRLPNVFERIESTIETHQRFEAYQTAVEAITHTGLSFHEWEALSPADSNLDGKNHKIMYILPS